MGGLVASALKVAGAGLVAAIVSSCAALSSIEPVIAPPTQFQLDRVVQMEFRPLAAVGVRCAERGATFLGLAALNSGACSDRELITMPDSCADGLGVYAAAVCGYVKHAGMGTRGAVTIAFVHPALVEARCAAAGGTRLADDAGTPGACLAAGALVVANPCVTQERSWYGSLACHELAHANGWPADHRGGSLTPQASFVKRHLVAGDVLPPDEVRKALRAKLP